MKRMLMVKRKGFNYYTDYTELYLHNAFQNYGYSIVRDKAKSDFSVFVYISEAEKYMKATSPFFDDLSENNVAELCDVFTETFKSEVTMVEASEYDNDSINTYEFMLSKNHSAYDEPVYLIDEPPKLERRIGVVNFKTNKDNSMSFVNVGGKISGINITLDFNEKIYDLDLLDARVSHFNGENFIRQEFVFEKVNNTFKADIDFVKVDKGINPKSAVLRGKKRATEEERYGFWLGVLPVSKEDVVLKGTLTIASGGVEIFKCHI